MHALLFYSLSTYLQALRGEAGWRRIQERAGLKGRLYLKIGAHPEAELRALLEAASDETCVSIPELLEGFGRHLVRDLVDTFRSSIDASWRTLEFLENAETKLHAAVRSREPGASPPTLECQRKDPRTVILGYRSHRRLCRLVHGMIQGVADHYGERVLVTETECLERGATTCRIRVRLA